MYASVISSRYRRYSQGPGAPRLQPPPPRHRYPMVASPGQNLRQRCFRHICRSITPFTAAIVTFAAANAVLFPQHRLFCCSRTPLPAAKAWSGIASPFTRLSLWKLIITWLPTPLLPSSRHQGPKRLALVSGSFAQHSLADKHCRLSWSA
jgi:hypothetical protein